MGWLVGFVENGGKKYAYACLVAGPNFKGQDARRIAEAIIRSEGLF